MRENHNGLQWEVDEIPIGTSTPDEFTEYSYRATATCPNCGDEIRGTANYWTDGVMTWLQSIDHNPCENCLDAEDEYIDEEDI